MGARFWGRSVAVTCALGALSVGLSACQPKVVTGLSSIAVAVATDQTGSQALEGHGVDVRWLTCKASVRQRGSASRQVADVDCRGRTVDGEGIAVKGQVTEEQRGRCVYGDLTAEVAGHPVFRADALGDCGREPTASAPPHTGAASSGPSASEQPSESGARTPRPRPTVTETVTVDRKSVV